MYRRWTFGALMFEMLTGEPPFTAGSIKELLHVIVNSQLVIPDKIRSKSLLAADAIERLLQKVRLRSVHASVALRLFLRSHTFSRGIWSREHGTVESDSLDV